MFSTIQHFERSFMKVTQNQQGEAITFAKICNNLYVISSS